MIDKPKISISNLHKSFGEKQVLQGIGIDIAAGKSLVIIGGSGTGKSVLLKCILGLLQADQGPIKIDNTETVGLNVRQQEKIAAKFGMLFQGGALFDSLSIWENVAFRLTHADGISKAEAKELAIETMARVNLPARNADLRPAELSGGMQKRVGLAERLSQNRKSCFLTNQQPGLIQLLPM